MGYNLVLRGGRVVDGSGLPSYLADVAIKDGRIVEIGRVRGNGGRTIDVHGLVVCPGFIDDHTHMDAQIQWDPYRTPEPEHGITSIVMGNDALALAPELCSNGRGADDPRVARRIEKSLAAR